jgi:hypothetical protein
VIALALSCTSILAVASQPSFNLSNASLPELTAGQTSELTANVNLTGTLSPQMHYELTLSNFNYGSIAFNNKTLSGIALNQGNTTRAVANNIQLATNVGPLTAMSANGGCEWNGSTQTVIIQNVTPCYIVFSGIELQRLQQEASPQIRMQVFSSRSTNSEVLQTNINYQFNPLLLH